MSNVINFNGVTRNDIPVDGVLDGAKDELDSAIVIGYTKDGDEYFSSSIADGGEILWLLERMKFKLLTVVEDEY